jgi:hypothetical protein
MTRESFYFANRMILDLFQNEIKIQKVMDPFQIQFYFCIFMVFNGG